MTLIVTSPRKTVNGLDTTALAILSQALYRCQRQDFIVTNTGLGASNKVRVVVADTTPFTAGDSVYLKTDVYDQLTTILTVVDGTLMDVGIEYTVVSGAGYINNLSTREGYHFALNILDSTGARLFETAFKYRRTQEKH